MEESIKQVTSLIQNYYDILVSSWYVLLPISAFFVFFSKLSSKISLFLIGLYTSYTIIIPYLLKIEFLNDTINKYTDYKFYIFLIFSLIIAIITYNLVKTAVSISAFVLGGLLGYSIGNFLISSNFEFINTLPLDKNYIPWIGFAIFGVIIALISAKDFDKILSTLCVIIGSLFLSFYSVFLLEKYSGLNLGDNMLMTNIENISNPEMLALGGLLVIYLVLGFFITFRKSSK